MSYNSPMHRKARLRKKYTSKERTAMKRASIEERRRIKEGIDKPNPFRGIVRFMDSIKNLRKGGKNVKNGEKGKHQRQER